MSIWDKYKTSEESIICMVGIVALCVSLSKVDGDFSDEERIEILKLIPHTEDERPYVLNLIQEIDKDNLDYIFHAENLKKYLSSMIFYDFIIATMYKLAWADHHMDKDELDMIQKTRKIFNSEILS